MTLIFDRRQLLIGAATSAVVGVRPAVADAPILKVAGKIAGAGERNFTLAELQAQPSLSFTTRTPWHEKAVFFEGIGFDALLDLIGATGTTMRLIALNDYVVEAEIAEFRGRGGLFAYRENGRDMPISDKGPLFLVFPFDTDPKLQHQSVYARCVWQIAALEIV